MKYIKLATLAFAMSLLQVASAAEFTPGPAIEKYGPNAPIKDAVKLAQEQTFKIAFDIAKQGESDKVNRSIESLARFINMHVRAGIKPENISLALVVHGKASNDLLSNAAYEEKFLVANPNHTLLNELLKNRTEIFICGQSAAYYEINNEDLHNGVQMSLSAMTAHALLQQQGYTLNPF